MGRQLVTFAPVVLMWAAAAYRLPAIYRNPRNPAVRAYWLILVSLALAFTLLVQPVYLAVDRAAGIPNVATLLKHSLALVSAWMVQTFLLHVNYPGAARKRVRRRGWVLAGALALMTMLFQLAPVDQETLDFTSLYAEEPFVQGYWLVFLAYLGLALVNLSHLTWRYGGLSDRVSMRVGLRLSAAGGVLGLGYVANKAAYIALRAVGLTYPSDVQLVSDTLLTGAILLLVVGSTMPAWGPRVGLPRLCRWLGEYRAHWRLYPLWRALYHSSPEIALVPASSQVANAFAMRQMGFRLYRRVIEIRDGVLALRRYLDPRVADAARERGRAAGLGDEDLRACVEAESLCAALRAKEQGLPPLEPTSPINVVGGSDLSTEVSYLEKVARYYAEEARRQRLASPDGPARRDERRRSSAGRRP